jgi:hypothetical protein
MIEDYSKFCSVCGCAFKDCQSPPVSEMDCYDIRQNPMQMYLKRHSGLSGSMTLSQKESYDAHHGASDHE